MGKDGYQHSLSFRAFTSSGALRHWWDQSSERGYANATFCLRRQYPAHFRRPLRIDKRSILLEVDGDFTLSENACDADGMGAAAAAFLDLPGAAAAAAGDDLVHLPNNPYSPQQLFFINAAQVGGRLNAQDRVPPTLKG